MDAIKERSSPSSVQSELVRPSASHGTLDSALRALRQDIRQSVDPNKELRATVRHLESLQPPQRLYQMREQDPATLSAWTAPWPQVESLEEMSQFLQVALRQVAEMFCKEWRGEEALRFCPGTTLTRHFADMLVHPLMRITLYEVIRRGSLIDLREAGDCAGGMALQLNEAGLRLGYTPCVRAAGRVVHPRESAWRDFSEAVEIDPVAIRLLIYRIERAREQGELLLLLQEDFGPCDEAAVIRARAVRERSPEIAQVLTMLDSVAGSVLRRYWASLEPILRQIFGVRLKPPVRPAATAQAALGSTEASSPPDDVGYLRESVTLRRSVMRLTQVTPALPERPKRKYTPSVAELARLGQRQVVSATRFYRDHADWITSQLKAYLSRHRKLGESSPLAQHGWLEEVVWDPEFTARRAGVVAAMLQSALLDCHIGADHRVYLDISECVWIADSNPVYAVVPGEGVARLVFSDPCAWAPEPNVGVCPFGIEPTSVLSLLRQLQDCGMLHHLEALCLDGFFRSGDRRLASAREALRSDPSKRLEIAYSLLHTLAGSLMDRYGPVVREGLTEFFNVEGKTAFVADAEVAGCSYLIERGLPWEPPERVSTDKVLGPYVRQLQGDLSLIVQHMAECAPAPQQWRDGGLMKFVQTAYHLSHTTVGGNCRIGSMSMVVTSGRASAQVCSALVECMADYLISPEGRARFKKICKQLGYSIDNAAFLLREGKSPFGDDLAYEIFAWTLNVRVGIFAEGHPTEKHGKTGMILPSGWVGPDTAVFLSFFCSDRVTFFGAHPRWTCQDSASGALKKAVKNCTLLEATHDNYR